MITKKNASHIFIAARDTIRRKQKCPKMTVLRSVTVSLTIYRYHFVPRFLKMLMDTERQKTN